MLQPLLAAIKTAHADVIAGAAQLGFQGVRLTPLSDLGAFCYRHWYAVLPMLLTSRYFSAGTENATRAAADDAQVLAQICARLEEFRRNPANQNSPQLAKCMQVRQQSRSSQIPAQSSSAFLFSRISFIYKLQDILKYQKLLLLLRGEFPSAGFMPPAPDGYIVKRITDLSSKFRSLHCLTPPLC